MKKRIHLSFWLLHILFYFLPAGLQATILYQDIPDQTLALGQFGLYDLTGDGTNDLAVTVNFSGTTFMALSTPTIGTAGSSNVQSLVSGANIRKLNAAFFVDGTGSYITGSTTTCAACIQNAGDWVGGTTDAYIGFRFTKVSSGTVHYGWLRVAVNATVSTITIKEIAYETAANTGLMTGFVPISSLQIAGAGGANLIAIDDATLQIVATIAPSNATMLGLAWTVDNPTVATVDNNGLLTAFVDGDVLVRAETQDGTALWDTVRIYVSNQIVPVASITTTAMSGQASINTLGGSLTFLADVLPTYASNRNVVWSVTDENIATIDNNGVLTARRNGTTKVVATSVDGSRVSGSIDVQISGQPIYLESIIIQGGAAISSAFANLQLSASFLPSNASAPNIVWSVSDNSIAGISNTGLLQAYRNGQITVKATATDGSGVVGTLLVSITNQLVDATAIQVIGQAGQTSISTDKGQMQMLANFSPATASNTHVFWSVDNPQIAQISPSGVLQARANGTVQVSATAQDGSGIVGTANIMISNQYELVQQLQISGAGGINSISSPQGTLLMEAVFTPISASQQQLVWRVNDPNIAYINDLGLLTALSNGNVTVSAITQDGSGIIATAVIAISNQPILSTSLLLQAAGGASGISSPYGTLQILPMFTPANASNQNLVWTVDNSNFALVDENGLVRALRNGSITITATTQDGSGIFASISLMISNQPIALNSLQVVSSSTSISVSRDTLQLSTIYAPTNATNTQVVWHSSNPQIATVSNTGILSAVSDGLVTITAIAQDGSGAFASQVFTISNQPIYATSITVNSASTINTISTVDGSLQMIANISPLNASNLNVVWQVDSPHIATINPNGRLIAQRNGVVIVSATTQDGSNLIASMPITISNQPIFVQTINLAARSQQINISGDTMQFYISHLPSNASNPNFIWRSSAENIAAISQTGLMTARQNGIVTVSAHSYDGGAAFGEYVVSITNQFVPITSLSIQASTGTNAISTNAGFLNMQTNYLPANASNPIFSWAVSDASIATINPNGRLHALSNGVVVVNATTQDGSQIVATATITITNQAIAIQNISIAGQGGQTAISTNNDTLLMVANITPANASNQNLVWRSDNPTIAQISQNGTIIPQANGVVQISAYALDGSLQSASAFITISNQSLNTTNISVIGQSGQNSLTTDGETLQMFYTAAPSPVAVLWSIDDPSIASISPTGLLTALSNGVVIVTATAQDGSNISGATTINVSNQPIRIATISVQGQGGQTSISSNNGTLLMEANITPANADNPNVVWHIAGGTGWAAIDPITGLLSAEQDGTIIVRASAQENPLIFNETTITISGQIGGAPAPATITISAAANFINTDNGFLQLQYSHSPSSANGNIAWSIAPAGIASIDNSGLLQALDNGIVTITATSIINTTSADYIVTISNQYIPLGDIILGAQGGSNNITVIDGSLQILTTTLSPANATNTNIFWAVDNPTIASINQNGLLRAHQSGNIIVLAYSQDGSGTVGSLNINVSNQFTPDTAINIQTNVGVIATPFGLLNLQADIFPTDATISQVAWRVDNPTIASIDANGILQAHSNGTVQVSAHSQDGSNLIATNIITISNQPIPTANITLSPDGGLSQITSPNDNLQILITQSPTNITNPQILWLVDNPLLASISQTGILTALKDGNILVKAYSQDGSGIIGTLSVSISGQPNFINSLQVQGQAAASSITTTYGSLNMEAIALPANASYPNVSWSVNDLSIGYINRSGILYARRNGLVTVTARTQDGSRIIASTNITISNQPILIQTLNLSRSAGLISTAAGTAQFNHSYTPANASNPNIILAVSDPSIANINKYGMLTAISNGLVYVYALTQDGSQIRRIDSVLIINQYNQPASLLVQGQGGQTTISSQNGTLQMLANALPTPNPLLTYSWIIAPIGSASITTDGLLIARQNGVITVTATAQDGSNATGNTTITISNQPIYANSIIINAVGGINTINTPQGNIQMLATLSPANVSHSNIAWSVSNPAIASISPEGIVRARANGIVNVIARSLDGTNLTSSIYPITITNQSISTTSLTISGQAGATTITSPQGSLQILPTFTPAAPSNPNLFWQSSNPNIATIDRTGLVTALRNGNTTITATTLDGSAINATLNISISNQPVYIADILLSSASGANLINTPFGILDILHSFSPAAPSNTAIHFWVSAPNIANINAAGQLRARQNGSIWVYAAALDQQRAIDSIAITISNQQIFTSALQILSPNNIDSIDTPNGNLNLTAISTPTNPSNPNIFWSSDNPSIATVSQNGTVLAIGNGTVVISVSAQDGSAQAQSLTIRVSNQTNTGATFVEDIDVFAPGSPTQITSPNGTIQFNANVFPANADNPAITWSVSDSRRASISADGLLTARADGNIFVFATSQDGSNISGIYALSLSNQPEVIAIQRLQADAIPATAYPNPFDNILHISLQIPADTDAQISICDPIGRTIHSQAQSLSEGDNRISFDNLAHLPAGLYFLHISSSDGQTAIIPIRKI
jgi:uncharacterized protein YjdB